MRPKTIRPVEMETKRATMGVSSLDVESRSFEVLASTETQDSHGDIVKQDWKLDRYNANPVVFFGHESWDLPIGKASGVRVVDGALHATVTLSKTNPKAEQVLQLMQEGMLKSISVGFRPGKRTMEKRGDVEVRVLSENELLELSVVAIGSNPDARAKHIGQHGAGAKETRMDRLTKALGLNEDASAEVLDKAFADIEKSITEAAGVASLALVPAKIDALQALVKSHATKASELDALRAKLEAEQAAAADALLVKTVDDAVAIGKIPPADKAEKLAKARKHGQEWIDDLVAGMSIIGGTEAEAKALAGKPGDPGATPISAETLRMLEKLGLTEEDHKAALADEAKEKRS